MIAPPRHRAPNRLGIVFNEEHGSAARVAQARSKRRREADPLYHARLAASDMDADSRSDRRLERGHHVDECPERILCRSCKRYVRIDEGVNRWERIATDETPNYHPQIIEPDVRELEIARETGRNRRFPGAAVAAEQQRGRGRCGHGTCVNRSGRATRFRVRV